MKIYPETTIDGYKCGHRKQFVPNMTLAFGNMTPRKSYRKVTPKGVVFFGLQYFLKEYLVNVWNKSFFGKPKDEVIKRFNRRINNYLGPKANVGTEHIAKLHDLGYLPLSFWALPEGVTVNYKVAPFVYYTTNPEFGWLQAYIETILSTTVWPLMTTATTAKQIRSLLEKFAIETVGDISFVPFQGHNFSYRGCVGHEAAVMIDSAFLTSFCGSDTVPGADFLEEYYNADSDKELISCSVPATEHAVMSSYGPEDEQEAIRRIIQDVHPEGIVSIVSDTVDYWNVIANISVALKDTIIARNGKVVFRPDSGDNVKIIVGDPDAPIGSPQYKGTVQVLWEIFGGTINANGYKELSSKVGTILGDGVTWDVMNKILEGLKLKGFASTNIVFGIGSFYLVYGVSRDTDGSAVKSTYCEVNGVGREIFKDPKTDKANLKKSAKGLIAVNKNAEGEFVLKDQATWEEVHNCEYKEVFRDGKLLVDHKYSDIRKRVSDDVNKELRK